MARLRPECQNFANTQYELFFQQLAESNQPTFIPSDPGVTTIQRDQQQLLQELNKVFEDTKRLATAKVDSVLQAYEKCGQIFEKSDFEELLEEIQKGIIETNKKRLDEKITQRRNLFLESYLKGLFGQFSRKLDQILISSAIAGKLRSKVAEMALFTKSEGETVKMAQKTMTFEEVKKKHQELITAIELIDDNKDNLWSLVEQVKGNGVIPFVGAGLSVPFGLKSWSGFLKDLAKTWRISTKVKSLLSKSQFEEAAQELRNVMNETAFHRALVREYGSDKLKGLDFSDKAVSVLPRLSQGPVITTNYDKVLETVFEFHDSKFDREVVGAKPDLIANALHSGRKFLLKIHGDIDDRTDRILTLADYQQHYGVGPTEFNGQKFPFEVRKPLPAHLFSMCLNRPLLFLGCSLQNDRTTQVFSYQTKTNPAFSHYAIVPYPGAKNFPQRAGQLSSFGIRPIWLPKENPYNYLKPILEFLADVANP